MASVIFVVLSFFLGVALAWSLPSYAPFVLLLLLLFRRYKAFLFLLAFFLGLWRVEFFEAQRIRAPEGEFVEISGEIVEEIDVRQDHQKITVLTKYGRVLLKVNLYQELHYGDLLNVKGVIESPSTDINGFNYAAHLSRYRIWWVMNRANVDVINERDSVSIRAFLYDLKNWVEIRLNELYMEPESSFAAGLILGSRRGMPEDLAQAFQAVGLTHIVAISGYNISLIIAIMFTFFSFLHLKSRVIITTLAIFLFVILVGASAAVVRAGIMGALALWALFTGRKSQVFFALLWSAFIMVFINPYILLYDVGFQLSFASTMGLLIFVPMLEELVPKWNRIPILREALLLTLAAQISTTPLILFHFGRFSWISPIANVLAAPFLAPAMFFSAASIIFGAPVAMIAWVNLRLVELIALWLSALPWIEIPMTLSFTAFLFLNLILAWISMRYYKHILVRAFVRNHLPKFLLLLDPELKKHVK